MQNANIPSDRELPSTPKLIKSTVLAVIGAGVLLVSIVMPAEYGIDPLGIGKITGLQQMGEIRVSLSEQATQEVAAKPVPPQSAAQLVAEAVETPALRNDTTTFTLAPNESVEIKAIMKSGQKVSYKQTSTGKINFDNHADSAELNIDYHGYSKGIGKESDEGVIEAAFDGKHGWFWRNRTKEKVRVKLVTKGEYSELVRAQQIFDIAILFASLLAGLHLTGDYSPTLLISVATCGNVLGICINQLLGDYLENFKNRPQFPVKEGALDRATRIYQLYGI